MLYDTVPPDATEMNAHLLGTSIRRTVRYQCESFVGSPAFLLWLPAWPPKLEHKTLQRNEQFPIVWLRKLINFLSRID